MEPYDNQLQTVITKISMDTIAGQLQWHTRLSLADMNEYAQNLLTKFLSSDFLVSNTFYYTRGDQSVVLTQSKDQNKSYLIIRNSSGASSFPIDNSDYFRLRTSITQHLNKRQDLLNNFLNDNNKD